MLKPLWSPRIVSTYRTKELAWIGRNALTVPAVGASRRITSYFGTLKLIVKMQEKPEEGYKKYSTFKIPKLGRWIVIVNIPELIEEVRKSPSDKLSFVVSTEDVGSERHFRSAAFMSLNYSIQSLAMKYTMGSLVKASHWHVGLVRTILTRNLGDLYSEIFDEISQAFDDKSMRTNQSTTSITKVIV
ncbi:hypothetical protein ACEPAH_1596 [Sanghuangporus vaninii]